TSRPGIRRSSASSGRPPCTDCRSKRAAIANAAERRAARWYRLRGWRILGANEWAGRNEIDLVARRGRRIRFVEGTEEGGIACGDPAEMVTAEKQWRVRRAAQ